MGGQALLNRWNGIRNRRWSIRDRVLVTLVLLTAAILLAVALAFHLFVRAYVWSRVSAQLDAIVNSVSAVSTAEDGGRTRSGELRQDGRKKRKFDGGQDRMTGVRGSVVTLDADGAVLDAGLSGTADGLWNGSEARETAEAFSAYFSSGHELNGSIRRKAVSLGGGDYYVSVLCDPQREDAFLVCYVDVTSIQAFTREVNLVLGGIILAALALSALLSRWFSRSFAEPIQRLSAFAGEIGQGDFRRRPFSFRDAEFHQLAESMNRMAEELQEANRKQETFFQNVSHELRTPLTSIRGCAEGIVCGLMEPAQAGTIILAEADRLTGFVEDILTLSRMGRAAPEGSALPLDLRDILSLCVSEQRVNAGKKSFTFDFDDSPVLAPIQERDARQLFGNLLSNALRYARTTVRLSCHSTPSGALVSVADDGPGVAPEDLPRVFERFYKGPGGKHGIGLSIVRAVAEAYHGSISVENAAAERGGGAVFTVRLPGVEAGTAASQSAS